MKFDILTLFPELIYSYVSTSILGNALQAKLFELAVHNPRDFADNKHKKVDDTVFGGGPGMLLMPQPFLDCLDNVLASVGEDREIIITSPKGQSLDQDLAQDLAQKSNLIILCGRYEGFDQRIVDRATMEISLGSFVLTGGELPALCILDSVARILPKVLGDDESNKYESFNAIDIHEEIAKYKISKKEIKEVLDKFDLSSLEELAAMPLLEAPQYTQPAKYKGEQVPEVLTSGNHKAIFLWRLEQSLSLTLCKK